MLASPLIQSLIVSAIVICALAMLTLRALKALRGKSTSIGCGTGCGSCANARPMAQAAPQLLQLETAKKDR